ncbi:hypothetical protein OIO90_003767 [Microbotryomycetes sp. JL221]|nr:hypothetical protein OIO90_003767 [Microbotryomycetes sp. JL221]
MASTSPLLTQACEGLGAKRQIRRKPIPSQRAFDSVEAFHIELDQHFKSWEARDDDLSLSSPNDSPYLGQGALAEDLTDGLWTSSCDDEVNYFTSAPPVAPSPSRRLSRAITSSPRSPASSFASTFSPFKLNLSRRSSLSFNTTSGVHIAGPPSVARRRSGESFDLPLLALPSMPLLFPSAPDQLDATKQEDSVLEISVIDQPSPSGSASSRSSGSTFLSHTSTEVTVPEASPQLSSDRAPMKRPQVFRIMSGGKAYFIEAGSSSTSDSEASSSSHQSYQSCATPESDNDDGDVLEISLGRVGL